MLIYLNYLVIKYLLKEIYRLFLIMTNKSQLLIYTYLKYSIN